MKRDEVITRLKSLEPRLRAHGVVSLSLYGSHARDEAVVGSDIDILADYAQDKQPSLSSFMSTCHELERGFPGLEIGLSTRDSLVPLYRPHIENSAIRVF